MKTDIDSTLKTWLQTLPPSKMVRPVSGLNRLKYAFWRVYSPFHPLIRDAAVSLGIFKHDFRQDFLLGSIAPDLTIQEFISLLIPRGFGNHFVAWEDDGEIVSLRYVEDFVHQYHVRVFADHEVRGHYEYTPECHPYRHIREIGMEKRNGEFLRLLGSSIVPASGT